MNTIAKAGVLAMVWATANLAIAQVGPEMPKPGKEHELLAQFAGEWDTTATAEMAPGAAPMVCNGTEASKMVGGFWLMGHGTGDMMGMPVASVLTIGFDPKTQKYVGTFVCSMDSHMWKYVGKMDPSGKKLTLETEGPVPMEPGKTAKFVEVLELKDKDHKTFTSSMVGDDGKLVKFATIEYVRKK